MRLGTRIFLGITVVAAVAFYSFVAWINEDLSPRYRLSTEEPLVDAARILAAIASASITDKGVDVELFRNALKEAAGRPFSARIYGFLKDSVDYRIYITDAGGTVIFDSDNGRHEGEDYSNWRDVNLTLRGEYGARTSRDLPEKDSGSVLYVAAPIHSGTDIVGVLTVGKPTRNVNSFVEATQRNIAYGAIFTVIVIIIVGSLLVRTLTVPIYRLTRYAEQVRDGKRVNLPQLGTTEIRALGQAFEQMRDALEGKQYVENYVQTLTHELKSPLAAIKGAAELLEEDLPVERKQKFLANIQGQTERIQSLIDRLLQLAALESRKRLQEQESVVLSEIVVQVIDSVKPLLEKGNLHIESKLTSEAIVTGEPFLIRQAVQNILQNALDFSPPGGTITVQVTVEGDLARVVITDEGPGVPEYAADRVFERFYSLERPDGSGKRTGIGLSFVKEVLSIHNGTVSLRNNTKGAECVLLFPLKNVAG